MTKDKEQSDASKVNAFFNRKEQDKKQRKYKESRCKLIFFLRILLF